MFILVIANRTRLKIPDVIYTWGGWKSTFELSLKPHEDIELN